MSKIWNITDSPSVDISSHSRMVFGQRVHPGKYMRVDEKMLEKAHKVQADIDRGYLYVGDKPPQKYLVALNRVRLQYPANGVRTHQHRAPLYTAAPKPFTPLNTVDPEPSTEPIQEFKEEKKTWKKKKNDKD